MAKRTVLGVLLIIIALFMIITGLVLGLLANPNAGIFVKDAGKEYDDWLADAEEGDFISVQGKIKYEEKLDKNDIMEDSDKFFYRLEGCDMGFWSEDDIRNEGDTVTVFIILEEKGAFLGSPMAKASVSQVEIYALPGCCCCFGGFIVLISFIMILTGGSKKKKNSSRKKEKSKKDREE
jgi:hypothetical protein